MVATFRPLAIFLKQASQSIQQQQAQHGAMEYLRSSTGCRRGKQRELQLERPASSLLNGRPTTTTCSADGIRQVVLARLLAYLLAKTNKFQRAIARKSQGKQTRASLINRSLVKHDHLVVSERLCCSCLVRFCFVQLSASPI